MLRCSRAQEDVTEAHGIIETGADDAAVPLDGGYGSFRGSLNLDVDLRGEDVGALEERRRVNGEGTGVCNNMFCAKIALCCHLLAAHDPSVTE